MWGLETLKKINKTKKDKPFDAYETYTLNSIRIKGMTTHTRLRCKWMREVSATELELETFEGVLEKVEGDVGYVQLTSKTNGDVLFAEFPAEELANKGILPWRKFECQIIATRQETEARVSALPQRELSEERIREIEKEIAEKLGDSDALQDDY